MTPRQEDWLFALIMGGAIVGYWWNRLIGNAEAEIVRHPLGAVWAAFIFGLFIGWIV